MLCSTVTSYRMDEVGETCSTRKAKDVNMWNCFLSSSCYSVYFSLLDFRAENNSMTIMKRLMMIPTASRIRANEMAFSCTPWASLLPEHLGGAGCHMCIWRFIRPRSDNARNLLTQTKPTARQSKYCMSKLSSIVYCSYSNWWFQEHFFWPSWAMPLHKLLVADLSSQKFCFDARL